MGVIAIVIPYEVFGRYVLKSMSICVGEVSTFRLGHHAGRRRGPEKGYQVSMTAVLEAVPPSVSKIIKGVGILMLIFLATITWYRGSADPHQF